MSDGTQGQHSGDVDQVPDARHVSQRAELLPEERAAGASDDPKAQAEAVLADSLARTEHPDPRDSTQSSPRSSEEAT